MVSGDVIIKIYRSLAKKRYTRGKYTYARVETYCLERLFDSLKMNSYFFAFIG